jgi:hypothetical protein
MGVECYLQRRCRSQEEWVGMFLLRVYVGVSLVSLAGCVLRCRVF